MRTMTVYNRLATPSHAPFEVSNCSCWDGGSIRPWRKALRCFLIEPDELKCVSESQSMYMLYAIHTQEGAGQSRSTMPGCPSIKPNLNVQNPIEILLTYLCASIKYNQLSLHVQRASFINNWPVGDSESKESVYTVFLIGDYLLAAIYGLSARTHWHQKRPMLLIVFPSSVDDSMVNIKGDTNLTPPLRSSTSLLQSNAV